MPADAADPADPIDPSSGGSDPHGAPSQRDGLAEGVEHLQAAAREAIRAGRSLLDAAEGLVDDPAALQGLVGTLGALAQTAIQRLGAVAGASPPSAAGDHQDRGDDGGVQRIKVT